MVMRFVRRGLKDDDHFWIERLHALRIKVPAGVEFQPVDPGNQRVAVRNQIAYPAVEVGVTAADGAPFAVAGAPFEQHRYAGRGPAAAGVENVCRYRAHVRFAGPSNRPDAGPRQSPSSNTISPRSIVVFTRPRSRAPSYGVTA